MSTPRRRKRLPRVQSQLPPSTPTPSLRAWGLKRRQRLYPVRLNEAHTRWAVREIAALNFLSHVPLAAEAALRRGRDLSPAAIQSDAVESSRTDHESYKGQREEALFRDDEDTARLLVSGAARLPFRRLGGRSCGAAAVPTEFRHRLRLLPGTADGVAPAVLRRWEAQVRGSMAGKRVFVAARRAYPVQLTSLQGYRLGDDQRERVRARTRDEQGEEVLLMPSRDWRGFSYHWLLMGRWREEWRLGAADLQLAWLPSEPFRNLAAPDHMVVVVEVFRRGASGVEEAAARLGFHAGDAAEEAGAGAPAGLLRASGDPRNLVGTPNEALVAGDATAEEDADGHREERDYRGYRPGELDDPDMVQGRHRHVLLGSSKTGPIISSTLLFVRPAALKAELNGQFRERHPEIPPSLTLSKIRSLKRGAAHMAARAGLDMSTVALASCYFERLCHQLCVTKVNRRVTFAACLSLAFKFNELRQAPVPEQEAVEAEGEAETEERRGRGKGISGAFRRALLTARSTMAETIQTVAEEASIATLLTGDQPSPSGSDASGTSAPDPGDATEPGAPLRSRAMEWMWHLLDQRWGVSRRQVLATEFGVFARLSFSLHAPLHHVFYHWHRLLPMIESDGRRYLGAKAHAAVGDDLRRLLAFAPPQETQETPWEGSEEEPVTTPPPPEDAAEADGGLRSRIRSSFRISSLTLPRSRVATGSTLDPLTPLTETSPVPVHLEDDTGSDEDAAAPKPLFPLRMSFLTRMQGPNEDEEQRSMSPQPDGDPDLPSDATIWEGDSGSLRRSGASDDSFWKRSFHWRHASPGQNPSDEHPAAASGGSSGGEPGSSAGASAGGSAEPAPPQITPSAAPARSPGESGGDPGAEGARRALEDNPDQARG